MKQFLVWFPHKQVCQGSRDIMCAVHSIAHMEIFKGEYTMAGLVMKAGSG